MEPALTAPGSETICVICRSPLALDEDRHVCPACKTVYHEDCWAYNKGCAVYGCTAGAEAEKLSDMEIPMAFWGQDRMPCPACGRPVLAVASRCGQCGALFSPGELGTETYAHKQAIMRKKAGITRTAVVLFVCSLIPFTAPFALLLSYLWRSQDRALIDEALSSQIKGMFGVGMMTALVQTLFLGLGGLFYMLFQF